MAINRVSKIDDLVEIKNILVSVSDKTGLELFIKPLIHLIPDLTIYSTGGTFNYLKEALAEQAGKHLVPVTVYTGQPEMEGGLVKTLDYKIYLGLLSEKYNEYHQRDLKRLQASVLDMVVVNLYPFKKTVAQGDSIFEDARGNIDIGGPCMLRAAAKNFLRVLPLCDPGTYDKIITELKRNSGKISLLTRFENARSCFKHTAEYDHAISEYLNIQDFQRVIESYNIIKG